MKVANIREFRNKATTYLKENDTILITRHGKITGLLYPVKETDTFPDNIQKEINAALRSSVAHNTNSIMLEELKQTLNIKNVKLDDIKKLQKEWKFKGSLSEEITAERDKR